jgi:peptidylprolyl isomerase
MNRIALIVFLSAFTAAAGAQTTPKANATGSSTPKSSSAAASTTKPSTTAAAAEPWIKLPPGVPRVAHGPVKAPFALHYEDIKVGAGAAGEAGKLWHIKYTGWRTADGAKFDSWEEHGQPVIGKDGKPELGPDGKPKMGDPQPMAFPQGVGRVIPGFDYGLDGMKIGGKRRIFIPWQMAYGTRAMPDRPDHPGIPAKSDLIFDVELVDVTEPPQRPMPPNM